MKAKLFFLGLCVLALAACSIDETVQVNDTDAVKFKVTAATRAEATTTNNLESFSVWAWNGSNLFMDDVVATKSGSSFVTSPLYFWPTGTVDFYALTPSTTTTGVEDGVEYAYIGGEFTYTDDEDPTWTYTGYVAKTQIAKDNIVIDAYIPGAAEDQIDLCYAVTKEQSSGTVSMNFRHALSQIVFKAMNTNSELTVDINGISVCSVYSHGTYALPTVSTTTNLPTDDLGTAIIADSQGSWDTNENHKARFVAGITATTLEGVTDAAVTLTSDDGSLMLLPQEVEAWDPDADATDTELGAYIRINCAVTEDGATIWPTESEADANGYGEIAVPVDIAWEEGWRYTYTIIFGDGLGYYPPDDENGEPGTPVLIPITFTVSVDEFQEADGIDISTDTGDSGDDEGGYDPDALILEYTFIYSGSNNLTLYLPIVSVTEAEIDWGDGSDVETVTGDWPSHTYSEVGTYTVSISGTVGGLYNAIKSAGGYDPLRGMTYLTAIKQWGDLGLTSMDFAFYGCSGLTSLPDGPGPFENVTSFSGAFSICRSLEKLPEDLFDNCTKVTSFEYAFYYNTSLEKLPDGLFDNCTNITSFEQTFRYCESLKELPTGLFDNCTKVTSFEGTFYNCDSLKEVPNGLFDKCTEVTSFEGTFYNCDSLKEVPNGLFDKCTEVTNFYRTFYNCSQVAGESPYDEINVDGNTVRVHLYERANYPESFTTPTSYSGCFANSTFSDMDSIPSSWGGNGN